MTRLYMRTSVYMDKKEKKKRERKKGKGNANFGGPKDGTAAVSEDDFRESSLWQCVYTVCRIRGQNDVTV